MPKASPIKTSFNSGELSPLLDGRADVGRYNSGCKTVENFVPMVQGGITKRSGARFVGAVNDSSKAARLMPFSFSTTANYVIEFGDQYLRFYKNGAIITLADKTITNISRTNPGKVTSVAHGYSTGDQVIITGVVGMEEVNSRRYTITLDGTTPLDAFTLDGVSTAAYTAYVSGGTANKVYEISSDYLEADLFQIKTVQSADVLYIAHPSYPPAKLSRVTDTSFTLADIDFDWPPFLSDNDEENDLLAISATTGTGLTMTCSTAIFDVTNHVGAVWKLGELSAMEHNEWEAGTAYTSGDQVYYLGNVYEAATSTTSGTRPPIHATGTQSDGAVDWLFIHPGAGYVKITSIASTTVATVDVIRQVPDIYDQGAAPHSTFDANAYQWAEGAWSLEQGYPSTAAFYQDRLVWAGSTSRPQSLWFSQSGDYENHLRTGADGEVLDDFAMFITLNASQVNAIRWVLEDEKAMLVGTSGGEWIIQPSTLGEALTPTNLKASRTSTYGSANISAVRAAESSLYITNTSLKARELAFVFEADGYRSPDVTRFAEHITESGVVEVDYAQEPNSILWCVRDDGVLIGMTYERSENVIGWHRHIVGGVSDADGNPAIVESVAVLAAPDEASDDVWMVVRRLINGNTVRYIERMSRPWKEADGITTAAFSDSYLTYSGPATTTLRGLNHLEGETVTVLVNGATHPDKVVSGGAITLDRAATTAVVGLSYQANVQTMRVEAGAADGVAQGKTKRITRLVVRLHETLGIKLGPTESGLQLVPFRTSADEMDNPPAVFSGDKEVNWPPGYDTDGFIYARSDQPLPCTILAFMPQVVTQDR